MVRPWSTDPVNPSFGGNTFNYQWMLSSAQAQDRTKDPIRSDAPQPTAPQRPRRSTISRVACKVSCSAASPAICSSKQFGEQELKEGVYKLGDFQVEIRNAADGVLIRIVDGKGGETTITVPFF